MQDAITQSAVKSILSKKDYKKGLFIDIRGNVKGVEFDLDKLSPNHIKNFKGVYYKKYEKVFPKGFDVHVVDMKLSSNFEERALDFLNRNSEWQYSGHKDIFKYRIELGKIGSDSTLVKTNDIKQAIIVLCHLCYHKRFDILVIANKKQLGYIKNNITHPFVVKNRIFLRQNHKCNFNYFCKLPGYGIPNISNKLIYAFVLYFASSSIFARRSPSSFVAALAFTIVLIASNCTSNCCSCILSIVVYYKFIFKDKALI